MKVTIITVCFNAQDHIEKTIQSVTEQTYFNNIEYVIVDGDSTDTTLEIVEQYKSSITHIISEKDSGIYDAMNKGIDISSGDIIYFLNSGDVIYDVDVIFDVVKYFERHLDAQIMYGKVKFVNIPDDLINGDQEYQTFTSQRFFLGKTICHQAIFTRRIIFENVGCFNGSYKVYADKDWLLINYKAGTKIAFFDRYICDFDCQGFSLQLKNKYRSEHMKIIFHHFSFIQFLFFLVRYQLLSGKKQWLKKIFRNLTLKSR